MRIILNLSLRRGAYVQKHVLMDFVTKINQPGKPEG